MPYYGYGASATGGAGGTTIHVTNLNNDGAGSLRDACENYTVPREIVFDVGGNKDPGGSRPHGIYMTSVNGDVTIRGESAPYPVTVKLDHSGASSPPAQEDQYPAFQLEGVDNVIFSHIAIRPTMWPYEVGEYANAESHQAISLDSCTNVVIDHCTLSDVQARCISSSGSSNNTDVTVSWCIFSDGYEDRPGSPGTAGKGISLHPGDTRWSIFNNVFTHLHSRMPQVIGDSDVRGNVVYNWRQDGAIVYNTVGNSRVNFTDHWTKTGPDSVGQETKGALNAFDWRTHPTYPSAGTLQIYVDDINSLHNQAVSAWNAGSGSWDLVTFVGSEYELTSPFSAPFVPVATLPDTLSYAGRFPRDNQDKNHIALIRSVAGIPSEDFTMGAESVIRWCPRLSSSIRSESSARVISGGDVEIRFGDRPHRRVHQYVWEGLLPSEALEIESLLVSRSPFLVQDPDSGRYMPCRLEGGPRRERDGTRFVRVSAEVKEVFEP